MHRKQWERGLTIDSPVGILKLATKINEPKQHPIIKRNAKINITSTPILLNSLKILSVKNTDYH
ncbi:hypothetical protein CDIMF43_110034 [Carnobacterium divergens]|nr:hypothetical protein CDIMF43_110034 [Carnobacterium divergens]